MIFQDGNLAIFIKSFKNTYTFRTSNSFSSNLSCKDVRYGTREKVSLKKKKKNLWYIANKNNQYLHTGPHSLIYNPKSQKFPELKDVLCDSFMGNRDLVQGYLQSLFH